VGDRDWAGFILEMEERKLKNALARTIHPNKYASCIGVPYAMIYTTTGAKHARRSPSPDELLDSSWSDTQVLVELC
jgi:hypothetical protein